jgi:outer membrane biosynthesis protein TonB
MPLDMPQDTMGGMDTMFQDMDVGNMSFDEVMQEVSIAVAEIENVGMEVDAVEIKMPDTKEFVEVEIKSEPKIEVQQTQEAVEEQPKEVEVVEVVAEQPKEEAVKEEAPKEEAPKEEIAEKEVEEEPVIEKVEKVEEQPKETAENKPTKEQVQKQKKAKRIMTAMASSYDPVSQMTTLALVNALGPDISTYSNQIPVVQPSWYETKEIYENTILPDPLGSYISVSSSLQMEKMVSQQYE